MDRKREGKFQEQASFYEKIFKLDVRTWLEEELDTPEAVAFERSAMMYSSEGYVA